MKARPGTGKLVSIGEATVTVKAVDKETFQEALERVSRAAARFAGKRGFLLQPDPAQRRYVLEGLARNLLEHGRPYCPCREVTRDPRRDELNVCPCRTHREEIERLGQCECGLYVAQTNKGREA